MKNLVKISFLYLIFLISGCVQLPSEVRQINGVMHYMAPLEVYKKLRTTKPCCNSYSEIGYSELSLNRNVLFLINSDSPAYKFETGKSYFAAFRLPSTETAYVLTIKSYFSGHGFYPSVLILDKNYDITRFVSKPTFKYIKPSLIKEGSIEGSIRFSPPDREESYIIILTTSELMKLTTNTLEGRPAYAVPGDVAFLSGAQRVYHFGPIGLLEVNTRSHK